MRFVAAVLTAATACALLGCAATHTVEVRISPNSYQVGELKSELATPAVNEVLRLNPAKVMMLMCRSTPNAKIIQFERELRARSKAELQGIHTDMACPV